MSILLDTNVLVRLSQQTHPHHQAARSATSTLGNRGEVVNIVPQNLYEFWAVATRPTTVNYGLGLTTAQTKIEIARIRSLFALLPDTAAIYPEWERLVEFHDVKGKTSHDARLVAAMVVHGVTRVLTFNDRDFTRYANIVAINPMSTVPPAHP
jgi:predicted nucleic acid-binding protein